MLRLAVTLYGMTSTTFAGTAVVVALVAGYATLWPLLIAAGAGLALAVPVSLWVAQRIGGGRG
jgi:Na+-driven multidrug efflux pump